MTELVKPLGKFEFDHVALGVHDTEAGAEWLQNVTGAKVTALEPEDGQWYWSHAMRLPDGAALEIIGPNPMHRGFHPIKETLRKFKTPSPFFWHLGTSDFDTFCKVARTAGAPVERIEHLDSVTSFGHVRYSRGVVGPGFRSTRPCVISWKERPDRPDFHVTPECEVLDFTLTSPKFQSLNRLFEALRIETRAKDGPEAITIRLKTPKGEVTLSSPGVVFEGGGAFVQMGSLWSGYLWRSLFSD